MTASAGEIHEGEGHSVPVRFLRSFRGEMGPREGDHLLVALSGGLDSTVLLHLLRFTAPLPSSRISAAHFDHRMREDSTGDRRWVEGLCRAWQVPLVSGEAPTVPASEDEAREARYAFLLEAKVSMEADWLLTGHHGDDQAETVLFRILRGTGLRGLSGIPLRRSPGVFRPLLPFTRKELRAYARSHGISFRVDGTNRDLAFPRNFLRHRVLPLLEERVASRASESLRRLATLARENEEGWESLLPGLLEELVEEDHGDLLIHRPVLLSYHPAVRKRLLRAVLARRGIALDHSGTRAAVEFTTTGASGGCLTLPGGFRLLREFDRFRVAGETRGAGDVSLSIPGPSDGSGRFRVGGREFQACWGRKKLPHWDAFVEFSVGGMAFPLRIRGWEPGDKIQLPYGAKKLKKLFGEARIPVTERRRIPVLLDQQGRVLWVAGLSRSSAVPSASGDDLFFLGIRDVQGS